MELNLDFINTYFTEEKIESIFFIFLGIISICLALIFLFIIKYSFYNGFAYPLLLIGMIQLTVGVAVCTRSQKDIIRVEQFIKTTPEKIKSEEFPRMKTVMTNFIIYKWIEIILIAIGAILFVSFYNSLQTFWKGFGLGLLLQACIMLSLDFIGQDRAIKYIDELTKISYQLNLPI